MLKRRQGSIITLLMSGLLWSQAAAGTCQETLHEDLEKVGQTTLRVMLFRVYDAELWTDTGAYPDAEHKLLRLTYHRDIKADQLVEQTAEEWESLGYRLDDERQAWLAQLADMWPDVSEGDCLLAATESGESITFYNATEKLGQIDDADFTTSFLAIWLSSDSSFPRNRDQLIGARE